MYTIDFEMTDAVSGLIFRDAIWLDSDSTLSEADIEEIKNQRFQNWLKAIQPEE